MLQLPLKYTNGFLLCANDRLSVYDSSPKLFDVRVRLSGLSHELIQNVYLKAQGLLIALKEIVSLL